MIKTIENALARWLNPNYAGVSTTADYEYLVSSLGYSGYDSMITEKNWQEFMSYEYAVLMDVAEFIWDGQEEYNEEQGGDAYVDKTLGPYPQEYYDNDSTGIAAGSEPTEDQKGPAYMPYLPVIQDYNSAKISKEDWDMLVLAGQPSARFGISDPGALKNSPGFNVSSTIMGGNRDVMPPTLMYEYKINPYEPEADGSLVPYISVLKEQLDYHYFTVGNREEFESLGDNPDSGGVNFTEDHIDKVDLMEISQKLNIQNPYIRNSTVWANYWLHAEDNPLDGKDNWIKSDSVYEQNLYFTNEYTSTIYKTPLQIMIDRYLPKASLLTSWYYLKDTDIASAETQGKTEAAQGSDNKFDVEQLMRDVKEIYNYYCWDNPEGAESLTSATVDSVTYSGDGTVIRGDDGKAIIGSKNIKYATTNNETFIHFGQAGIEANLFNVFHMFDPEGEHASIPRPEAPASITGDEDLTTVPVITELLSDQAFFMDRFGFKVTFEYKYHYHYYQQNWAQTGSHTYTTIKVPSSHSSHISVAGSSFSLTTAGKECYYCKDWATYEGKNVTYQGTEKINDVTYYKYKIRTATASGAYDVDGVYHAPGGSSYVASLTYRHGTATATAKIIIPYEATLDLQPRGDSYTMDPVSQIIHDQVVLKAEETAMEKDFFKSSAEMEIESMEREFVNHGYWYAEPEKCEIDGNEFTAEPIGFFDDRYRHSLGFYNFGATKDFVEDNPATATNESNINNANYQKTVKNNFRNEINTAFHNAPTATPAMDPFTGRQMVTTGGTAYSELTGMIKNYLRLYYATYECTSEVEGCQNHSAIPSGRALVDMPTPPTPGCSYRDLKFDYVMDITNVWLGDVDQADINKKYIAQGETGFEISNMILNSTQTALVSTGIDVSQYNLADGPKYTQVSTQTEEVRNGGIFDIDDYVLSMSMDVPQKRISTMIVTDVEAWAKSATYQISIHNNTFDYTNYRYVVPHSFFNFGVKVFRIDELPTYRTEYYKTYFSKINDPNAGIKEADILTMMLKWEEFARSGNDTAYAYMRDLYKLVIYVREKFKGSDPQILDTAYTYLYVPDTIWEFREGISQEAFWTERLAAEMPGNPDALSQEELEFVRVKKDDISWQILDYDEYSECQYEENGELKAKVYALFPFGSPYTRTFFMQNAIDSGTFNDGGYKNGHGGADWTSRATNAKILDDGKSTNFDGTVEEQIYEYELKTRTARKILNTSIDLNTRLERAKAVLLGGNTSDPMAEAAAKEINAELEEYSVKSPIVSIAGGIVTRAHYDCYSGFAVAVTHTATGRSAATSYVHMRRWPSVQEGDIVGPGTVVGYEGTTGNSRGVHLHQNLNIGGDKDSPAEYMGPIFAPFYNKDKIFETFTMIDSEWGGTKELILGTEYMELIRTVLMYPLNEDGTFQDGGALFGTPNGAAQSMGGASASAATLLKESTFYYDATGNCYIDYGSGDIYSISSNKVIVKIGGNANPKYYECTVSWEDVPSDSTEDELNYNSDGLKRLRVTSKTEINIEDVTINPGVRVKIDMSSYGVAPVVWGNNVPLSVLIEDMADAVDITVLNTQRAFKPSDYASEFAGSSNDPTKKTSSANVKDVTADPILFTPEAGRLTVPDWIISYMTDVDCLFAVPFYDGPLDLTMQNSGVTPGDPGSQSGDVILLKKALIMKGFATSEELDTSGEYNDKLENVLKKVVASGAPYSSISAFGEGKTGKRDPEGDGHVNDWSNRGVTDWNAVVTYGSLENAKKAGRDAASMGATLLGQREAFIHAVARHESSFIPTAESMIFCGAQADSDHNFINYDAYPTETLDYTLGIIDYKGIQRTLRRATGLMQLAPATGISRARAKVGDDIDQIVSIMRSPRSNAEIGSEILTDNINSILRNKNGEYDKLKQIVDANPAFEKMYKDCGIDPYQIALMGASALMYNRGPGTESGQSESNTMRVINSMANVTYEGGTVSGSGGICGVGYWVAVMNEVVNNQIG